MSKISLLPLDVGFDLRRFGMNVTLPEGDITVTYLDKDNKSSIFVGNKDEVKAVLIAAGYDIKN